MNPSLFGLRPKQITALEALNQELQKGVEEWAKVKEELQLFVDLMDQSNDAIFVIDVHVGRVLNVNQTACQSLGYTKLELLNMTLPDIDPTVPRDKEFWPNRVKEIKEKGSIISERENRRKDGTVFPVEISTRFITRENKSYIVSFVRDITQRKNRIESLSDSYKHVGIVNRKMGILCDIAQCEIVGKRKVEKYLLDSAIDFTREDYGLFYEYDNKNKEFDLRFARGFEKDQRKAMSRLSFNDWDFIEQLVSDGKWIFKTIKYDDLSKWGMPHYVKSFLVLPLINGGELLGMIVLASDREVELSEHPRDFYSIFSALAAQTFSETF